MKTTSEFSVCALLVGDEHDDARLLLHEVFRDAGWLLFEARDRRKALECIDRHSVQVVIASREVGEWNWKNVLESLRHREPQPQLIVTCRTADEQLWSEVLNCGGYDVLPQPFQRDEIERVVASARRQYDRLPHRAMRRTSATRTSVA
jgi:DNA-binding NtrC family response regulator